MGLQASMEYNKKPNQKDGDRARPDPDALALQYFDTELNNLLVWQALQIADELAEVEREELKRRALASGESGHCFECGTKVSETSSQCGACKEGYDARRNRIPTTTAKPRRWQHMLKASKRRNDSLTTNKLQRGRASYTRKRNRS